MTDQEIKTSPLNINYKGYDFFYAEEIKKDEYTPYGIHWGHIIAKKNNAPTFSLEGNPITKDYFMEFVKMLIGVIDSNME